MQHAVATDVRTDCLRDPFVVIILDERDQFFVCRLFPSAYRDHLIFGISSEDDFLRIELGDPGSEYFRILHGDTSARNHLRTAFESNFQVSFLFQSTSEINDQRSTCRQPFQHTVVDDPPLPRSVQVYHMQTPDAMIFKHLGYFQRIFVIHFLGVVITLGKAYAFPVDHIYCRNQLYHITLQF